jgi:RNA polymerase sigma-70 factor (ECF subfamily)
MSSDDHRAWDPAHEDAAVIERVLDGDTQQFAMLVERYQRRLYRYAAAMVLDHALAEDMVQDVFVRAYSKLGECRDPLRFRSWLFRMLRNRCFDHLKSPLNRAVPLDTAASLDDHAQMPNERLEQIRLRAALAESLAALPDIQREAFLMHHVEAIPYETMSELLDVSVSALKMRVLRAREALAAALTAQDCEVTELNPARLSVRRG